MTAARRVEEQETVFVRFVGCDDQHQHGKYRSRPSISAIMIKPVYKKKKYIYIYIC